MKYQVLARKWRPKKFKDIIGQDHILKIIKNSIMSKKLHHAYLFTGARGIGKTTIARLLNKSINCKKKITFEPCGICKNCIEIDNNCFIDFIEIDAASRTKIEDMKEILNNINYTTTKGVYKVYLIDEVHMLSKYSFDALLKTLEEPPEHIKFILATTNPDKLPETIISRCLQFHLKKINYKQIYYHIKNILNLENIIYESSAIKIISKKANGSIRDALNLTDQAISLNNKFINKKIIQTILRTINENQILKIIKMIIQNKIEKLIKKINQYDTIGINWENLIQEMLFLLHKITINQILNKKKSIFSTKKLQFLYKYLIKGYKELKYVNNKKIGIEMIFLRIIMINEKKNEKQI